MRVSIVIPVRNGEAFLAQTLRSALNQTRPPDEVIVVDDGSTDASARIALGFGPSVRLLEGDFANGAAARKAGMAATTGDAIMFLDADDLLGLTALEELVAALDGQPDAIACCPWKRFEMREGCWLAAPASCAPRGRGQDDLSAWLSGWYHPPCAVLWSRSAYEASGGWDPQIRVNQDGDVMMRALAAGVELVATSGGTAYYRRAPDGGDTVSGRRFSEDGIRSRLEVLDKIVTRLEEAGRRRRYAAALAHAYRSVAADAHACPEEQRRALEAALDYGNGTLRARNHLGRVLPHRWKPQGKDRSPRLAARVVTGQAHAPTARPLVSVIVPTYNRTALLARALRSVLAQTYDRFEVVVVDDGSTENVERVVRTLKDERVVYLRQEINAGVAAARNRGLRQASGELIAFLDSDDEWAPAKLEAQVSMMVSRPERVGLTYTGVAEVHGEGAAPTITIPAERGDVFREMLHRNVVHFGTSSVMIRASVVATVGLFDEHLPAIEDYDYWIRIARFYEFGVIPEALITYHNEAVADDRKRSHDFAANMTARRRFAERYAWEAAEAGVLHKYLLESARKELELPEGRGREGTYLLMKAARWKPTEPRLYLWIAYSLLPKPVRQRMGPRLKSMRRRLPNRVWFGAGPA